MGMPGVERATRLEIANPEVVFNRLFSSVNPLNELTLIANEIGTRHIPHEKCSQLKADGKNSVLIYHSLPTLGGGSRAFSTPRSIRR